MRNPRPRRSASWEGSTGGAASALGRRADDSSRAAPTTRTRRFTPLTEIASSIGKSSVEQRRGGRIRQVRRPLDLQVLEFRRHARWHHAGQRAERCSGTSSGTRAAANARTANRHAAEDRTDLPSVPAFHRQPGATDFAVSMRRSDALALRPNEVLEPGAARLRAARPRCDRRHHGIDRSDAQPSGGNWQFEIEARASDWVTSSMRRQTSHSRRFRVNITSAAANSGMFSAKVSCTPGARPACHRGGSPTSRQVARLRRTRTVSG